jgi:hypothetical protein
VADEPSNGELARQLADIKLMLAAVVGSREYAADQRNVDYRFADLAHDLSEERRAREAAVDQARRDLAAAIEAINARITTEAKSAADQAKAAGENRMHWRTLLWTGAIPAAVAAIGVLMTWVISRGGH